MSSSAGPTPPSVIPPGWIGGFSTSNPAFAYPHPNLSSIPMRGNNDNIPNIRRALDAKWPEFTWETVIGDPSSRCYRMFAPDISSIGYDDAGQIWAIICPQQGLYSPTLGTLNVEVSVIGQRGWVDETAGPYSDLLAADMSVVVKLWFSPSARERPLYDFLASLLAHNALPFPLDKAHAIQVKTHAPGRPDEPNIAVRSGTYAGIPIPGFANHESVAFAAANVVVEIGEIQSLNNPVVDDFNAMIVDIFNLGSGNLLRSGNALTWNVWTDPPRLVDQKAWAEHAEYWRRSIDTGHGSPHGEGSQPRYFDGRDFEPIDAIVEEGWLKLKAWLKAHFPWLSPLLPDTLPAEWGGPVLVPSTAT